LRKVKPYLYGVLALVILGLTSSYTPVPRFTEVNKPLDSKPLPENQNFVKVLRLDVEPHTHYKDIDFGFVFTSFVFEIEPSTNFANAVFVSEQDEVFKLDSIPRTDQPGDERRSPFVIPESLQYRFNFYSGDLDGQVRIYLFYAPPIQLTSNKHFKKAPKICDKPEAIEDAIWRKGLPDPIGNRIKHAVNHCVIHHAASSNTNHDYVNVVRNIYLLHTQTNGWDDIGYNFVVAQDGSIFEGRAHQNIDSTDNIKGAHFCGKNSSTMGVCVLGNYQSIQPTQASIQSLQHLLTWKCNKDNISATGQSNHPSGSSTKLSHIAGHQDGCATACPGDSLYRLLPTLRNTVDSLVKTCGSVSTATDNRYLGKAFWHLNAATKTVHVTLPQSDKYTAALYNFSGQLVWESPLIIEGNTFKIPNLQNGSYVLNIILPDNQRYTTRILVY